VECERYRSPPFIDATLNDAIDLIAATARAIQTCMDYTFAYLATLIGAESDGELSATIGVTAVMSHAT